MVEDLPAMQETWIRSLGLEDPLKKGKATHSNIPSWRIPWTEQLGRLQFWHYKQSSKTEWLTLSLLRTGSVQFSSLQSLSRARLSVTPWTAALQASLSITNSESLLKLMSIESVMPSSHLILCHPLLLPPIPPSMRVFSDESFLHIRWPKYWSFSFSISPSNEYSGLFL